MFSATRNLFGDVVISLLGLTVPAVVGGLVAHFWVGNYTPLMFGIMLGSVLALLSVTQSSTKSGDSWRSTYFWVGRSKSDVLRIVIGAILVFTSVFLSAVLLGKMIGVDIGNVPLGTFTGFQLGLILASLAVLLPYKHGYQRPKAF